MDGCDCVCVCVTFFLLRDVPTFFGVTEEKNARAPAPQSRLNTCSQHHLMKQSRVVVVVHNAHEIEREASEQARARAREKATRTFVVFFLLLFVCVTTYDECSEFCQLSENVRADLARPLTNPTSQRTTEMLLPLYCSKLCAKLRASERRASNPFLSTVIVFGKPALVALLLPIGFNFFANQFRFVCNNFRVEILFFQSESRN
jgi:hypothetical protein